MNLPPLFESSRAADASMESMLLVYRLLEHRIYPETGSHFRVRCSSVEVLP